MRTIRWLTAAALAGVWFVATAENARAQSSSYSSGGMSSGSSSGGVLSSGSLTSGGSGGGSSGGVQSQGSLIGNVSGFTVGSGQMISGSGMTYRASTYFNYGSNNPFSMYAINPLASSLGTMGSTSSGLFRATSSVGTFGTPLFGTTGTTANTLTGGTGGSANVRGASGMSGGTGRIPAYTTTIDFDFARPAPGQIQVSMQGMLDRTSALAGNPIRVRVTSDDTVILTGAVATERQKRLAENLVRLTPGVADVRNDLAVTGAAQARR